MRMPLASEEVEALATELGLKLFRASVKDNTNINPGTLFSAPPRCAAGADPPCALPAFDAIVEGWHENKKNQALPETGCKQCLRSPPPKR